MNFPYLEDGMFSVAVVAILVTMLMALARAIRGPDLFNRILAVNAVSTKVILLLALITFLSGNPNFLDIALVYALINFVSLLAFLNLLSYTQDTKNTSTNNIDNNGEVL